MYHGFYVYLNTRLCSMYIYNMQLKLVAEDSLVVVEYPVELGVFPPVFNT